MILSIFHQKRADLCAYLTSGEPQWAKQPLVLPEFALLWRFHGLVSIEGVWGRTALGIVLPLCTIDKQEAWGKKRRAVS